MMLFCDSIVVLKYGEKEMMLFLLAMFRLCHCNKRLNGGSIFWHLGAAVIFFITNITPGGALPPPPSNHHFV